MEKGKLKIVLVQLDINWEDKADNQKKCQKFIKEAAKKGADIIVFPEMTLTGFSMDVLKIGESEKNSQTIQFFSQLAKKYSISIVFGVVFKGTRKGKNVLVMVDRNGDILAKYQKIHPFSYAKENKYYEEGKKVGIVQYLGFKIGLIVCYDLRFAGLVAALAKYRPDIVVVIANWPKARIDHWLTLLKARALDIQSYVVGVNRLGKRGRLEYNGQSSVFSPKGESLLNLNKQSLGFVNLDKNKLEKYRKSFPFLSDSRNKLYSGL